MDFDICKRLYDKFSPIITGSVRSIKLHSSVLKLRFRKQILFMIDYILTIFVRFIFINLQVKFNVSSNPPVKKMINYFPGYLIILILKSSLMKLLISKLPAVRENLMLKLDFEEICLQILNFLLTDIMQLFLFPDVKRYSFLSL